MNIFLFTTGLLCISYDIILICLNPGTFLDNLFSFTHIWSVLGAYMIFLSVYRKKTGHSFWKIFSSKLKIIVCSVLITAAGISALNLAFILTPEVTDISEEADYLFLLGGGISKDGILPYSVIERVEKAAEYLNLHKKTVCVVTGGTLNFLPYPEAPEIKKQLSLRGIEQERILIEDKALDTIQNFQLSCRLLSQTMNVPQSQILKSRIIIVTSHFHLRRAERLARRMGFTNTKGIPSKCPIINIPHTYIREICSYCKLNLRILFTGKPKPITDFE